MADPAMGPPDGDFVRYIERLTREQSQTANATEEAWAVHAAGRSPEGASTAPDRTAQAAPAPGAWPDLLVAGAFVAALVLCFFGSFASAAAIVVFALVARFLRRLAKARAARPAAVPPASAHAKRAVRP